jgi:hypothetical protein
MKIRVAYALLFIAAVAIVPACGDSGDDGGSSGFQDYLIDDFDAGLVHWTVLAPSVTINGAGIGRGPSMHLAAQGGVPAEARTVATFPVGAGLSMSFDLKLGSSTAQIFVVDNAAPAVRDTFALINPTSIEFMIQGQPQLHVFPADSFVHKFLFHAENGFAQWQRDGLTYFSSAYTPGTVFLDVQDKSSGSDLDLVHISTP